MITPADPTEPSKANPYASKLLVNRLMTEGSDKETRHFELSLQDSNLDYLPGDSLGVLPINCESVVSNLLNAVGLSGEETVELEEESLTLKVALLNRLACTVLSKIQIKKFNEFARSEKLANLLDLANIEYRYWAQTSKSGPVGQARAQIRPPPRAYHPAGLCSLLFVIAKSKNKRTKAKPVRRGVHSKTQT